MSDIKKLEKIGDIFTQISKANGITEINQKYGIPKNVDIGDLSGLINIPIIINTDTLISLFSFKNDGETVDINTLNEENDLFKDSIILQQVKETIDIIIDIIKNAKQEELKKFLKKTTGISDTKKPIIFNIQENVQLKNLFRPQIRYKKNSKGETVLNKNNNPIKNLNRNGKPQFNDVGPPIPSTSSAYIHECFSIIDILRFNLDKDIFFEPFELVKKEGGPEIDTEVKKQKYISELKLEFFGEGDLFSRGGSKQRNMKQRTNKQKHTKHKKTKQRNTKYKNTKKINKNK